MSANTILTSTVTGGSNNHTTTSEEANSVATDFVTQGVVGAITLNTGSGGTGSFCVNADASPDMGVTIKAGQAYITATPSSQNSQVLRARAAADYTAYTISANASGSTKYDWIYLKVDATKANNPASDASDVTSIVTSRSSSNSTDNGSPPTYGLLLAVVTVANGASSITNSNITDKRFNTSIGAQNGSLIVTQQTTGSDAIVQAAGQDANINLTLNPKGTGIVVLPANSITGNNFSTANMEILTFTPGSNTDGTAGSYQDWITVGNATIPSWCTSIKAVISVLCVFPVTASNNMNLRLKIGSDTETGVSFYNSSVPASQTTNGTWSGTITPSATGSQSVVIQQNKTSGPNGIRAGTGSSFTVQLFYR